MTDQQWNELKEILLEELPQKLPHIITLEEIEEGIKLFRKVLVCKNTNEECKDLGKVILDILQKVFIQEVRANEKRTELSALAPKSEAFVKHIVSLIDPTNYKRSKMMMHQLKKLNLFDAEFPDLKKEKLKEYKRHENPAAYNICLLVVARNEESHEALFLSRSGVEDAFMTLIAAYIYIILRNKEKLKAILIDIPDLQDQTIPKYRTWINKLLSQNPSHQLLKTDFGVDIEHIQSLQIKIKAKAEAFRKTRNRYTENGPKGFYMI